MEPTTEELPNQEKCLKKYWYKSLWDLKRKNRTTKSEIVMGILLLVLTFGITFLIDPFSYLLIGNIIFFSLYFISRPIVWVFQLKEMTQLDKNSLIEQYATKEEEEK
jgi:hypothetical protein